MSRPSVTVEEFRAAVKGWVQSRDVNRLELAKFMEIPQSWVDGWWLGKSSPHPLLQAKVVEWINARKQEQK